MSLKVDTMKEARTKQKHIDQLIKEGTDPKSEFSSGRHSKTSQIPQTIGELVKEFLESLETNSKVNSELTIRNLKGFLTSFLIDDPNHKREGILKHNTPLSHITESTVDKILDTIHQRYSGNTKPTIAAYILWLFNYAVESGYIETNPFSSKNSKFPKKTKDTHREIRLYKLEEINQMREYLKKLPRKKSCLQDVYFFALNTGLRRMELFNLTWRYVDLRLREIRITGKGGKVRTVPLNDEALSIIEKRNNTYQSMKIKPFSDRVFWDLKHPNYANLELCKMLEDLRLPSGRLHDFRHTWATNCIRNGMPTKTLKDIGGWSDFKTMEIYIHLAGADLHRNINEYTRLG